jgi:hypothetical protein
MKRLPVILLGLMACITVSAAPQGLVFLGERVVDFHAQRDVWPELSIVDTPNYADFFLPKKDSA